MAGTAETRKEGGALRAQWPTERTDSQSARIFDSDERPAIETGQRRSPLAVTDTGKRFRDPGPVTREARPPKAYPAGTPVWPQRYPGRRSRHASWSVMDAAA